MDPVRSDKDLDLLLARGHLSGAVRERVLERVLDATAAKRRPAPRRAWAWGGVAFAGAAAAAALLVVRSRPDERFTAKGGADTPGAAHVEVACIDGSATRCALGSMLVFRVEGAQEGGFLLAYAQREGAPDDARIWYFPASDGSEPELARQAALQVVGRAVRLGPEHAPGRYAIHAMLARKAMPREAALDRGHHDLSVWSTSVVEVTP